MRIPIVTMLFTALLSVSSVAGKNRGDGMIPFLAITGKPVEAEVTVPTAARTSLRLATGGRLAQVRLAGRDLGVRAWAPFEWDVPADLAGKKAKLEISVSTSVQPMFGDPANGTWDMRFWNAVSGPDGPCGLLAAAWLECWNTCHPPPEIW